MLFAKAGLVFFSLVEKRFFCVLVCTNMLAPGLPGPDPGRFLRVQKVTKDTPKGKGPFARSSPLGNPHSFGRPKRGLRPPFWIFPGGLILRWKMTIPAPVSGFGLVRFGYACVERGILICACRGCVFLFDCLCAARLWRGRGSGVLGGGRYTVVLLLQVVLICRFVKSTPSSRRHSPAPPTAAARWCATCKAASVQRIAQQQRKQKYNGASLPQYIPVH